MEASYQSCIFCISSRWLKILHFQMSVSASSNGLEYFEESLFWYSSKEFFAKLFFFDFILACINIKQIWNASKFFIRIQMYCSARLKLVRCDGFYGRGVGFTRSCRADPAFSMALFASFFCLFWSGKKRKDIRGNAGGLRQHMITENSWEMKVCPLHPSSCPKQPVLQSPTLLSFVLTKKSWQTIFVGLK